MTVLVSGRIWIVPGRRSDFLRGSMAAVAAARQAPGCIDFVVAPDPLDADRVNVFEEWESVDQLLAFRGDGPDDGLGALITRADVKERQLN